ncbi:MAG: DUF3784 domain-containing protein [Bacillota bacterium]
MSVILFIIGGVFFLIAYLIGAKKMVGLIAGVNTASQEQRAKLDLPAVARAMGIGLACLGGTAIIAGALGLSGVPYAFEAWMLLLFFGIWFLTLFVQKYDGSMFDAKRKPTKRFYIFAAAISALMILVLAFIGWLVSATLKDPVVSFSDDRMTIGGLYGTELAKTDIESVSLLSAPPTFREKTDGSAVLGAYKGNFTSSEMGKVLAYVKDGDLPWILIERNGKPVLLCLSDPKDTSALYERIDGWLKE